MSPLSDLRRCLMAAGYRSLVDPAGKLAAVLTKVPAEVLLAVLEQLELCAEECMERRLEAETTSDSQWISLKIFTHLRESPEALEVAVIAFLAALVDSELAPSEHIYPAALLVNLLKEPRRPSAAFERVAATARARVGCWGPMCDKAEQLADAMLGRGARWPHSEECRVLVGYLESIEPVWIDEAERCRGRLRGEDNRHHRRALAHATQWCTLLRQMVQRIEHESGCLHLLGDYLLELLTGARRHLLVGHDVAEIAEAVLDDLGVVLYSVAGTWARIPRDEDPFMLHEAGIEAFPRPPGSAVEDALRLQVDRRRKRLSRGRRRCLARWTATEPDSSWGRIVIPNLRALASHLEQDHLPPSALVSRRTR